MKGDFTRSTFDPARHYSGVRMQQGRVQLDADWNEQLDITSHRIETGTFDVIGQTGVLQGSDAFKIALTPDNTDLAIAPGRIYVDGILCELCPEDVSIKHGPGNTVTLDTLSLDGHLLAKDEWVEIQLGKVTSRRKISAVNIATRTLTLTGDDLVGGSISRLHRLTTYITQADLPGQRMPTAGTYVIVLDVWDHHITAFEDPNIREEALGGPDTATRTQVVGQVKLIPLTGVYGKPTCGDVPSLQSLVSERNGRLRARAHPEVAEPNPCLTPAGAGYRRLENQLYRVEVHRVRNDGTVTFKWSRDNGSVVTDWRGREGNDLLVSNLGRDSVLGFRGTTWAELIDETHELRGDPGILVRVTPSSTADNTLTIEQVQADSGIPDTSDFPRHPKVRRWDSKGEQEITIAPDNDGYLTLEGGVEVRFEMDGVYQPGDYWLIPARTAVGDEGGEVLWPCDLSDPNAPRPVALRPHGIDHHYGLLGVWWVGAEPKDCRSEFPPLTKLTSLLYESGDGQEAMPGHALPHPLQVRVVNGQAPVVGARVRWSVVAGGGALNGTEVVAAGSDGIAEVAWTLGNAQSGAQRVKAELLDAAGSPVPGQVLHFNATLSEASAVAYHPIDCSDLGMAGAATVQEALDEMCRRQSGAGCALMVPPGEGWQRVFDQIGAGEDAHICLQVGAYPTIQTIEVKNKGHITLSGGGRGTRITADKLEAALIFRNCSSVTVRDLAIKAGRSGQATRHLNGALTFRNCGSVDVERVQAECAAGAVEGAACVAVSNCPELATLGSAAGGVRVRGCHLGVGHMQVGLLLVNTSTANVADNTITVVERPKELTLQRLLQDKTYRASVRKFLVANADSSMPTRAAKGAATARDATVSCGRYTVRFCTEPEFREVWQALVIANPPKGAKLKSERDLLKHVETLADHVLLSEGRYGDRPATMEWYGRLAKDQPSVASQGIVIAGEAAPDVRVIDNIVQGVLQGIRVGVSHQEDRQGAPDFAGRVQIVGNTIGLLLPPVDIRERYGIFVGNCKSLRVENNRVAVSRHRLTAKVYVEGIRIFGHLGRMALVQANHLVGATIGVRIAPRNPGTSQQSQWLVSTNMAELARIAVVGDRRVRQRDNLA